MNDAQKQRLYTQELGCGIAAYAAVLIATLTWGTGLAPGVLQTAVFLLPMLPFLWIAVAIIRHLRRVDEYIRQTTLEHIAIAAAVTAAWTFSYGFLENAGYPKLSMFTVWPVMGAVWGVVACMHRLRNR